MTVGELEDAKAACKKALEVYQEDSVIVSLSAPESEAEELLKQIAGARGIPSVRICHVDFAALPELEIEDNYAEVALEKQDWKARVKEQVRQILKYKPEAVYVQGNVFETYPIVHALRKKHIPVLTMIEKAGRKLIVRIPSGS